MSKYSSLLPSALILCPFLDRHPVINVLQTFYTLLILMPPLRTKAQIAKNLRHIRFSALTTEKAKLTYFRSHLPTQVHSISSERQLNQFATILFLRYLIRSEGEGHSAGRLVCSSIIILNKQTDCWIPCSVILDIAEDDSGTSTQDDLCIAEIQDLRSDGDKGKEVRCTLRLTLYQHVLTSRISLSTRSFAGSTRARVRRTCYTYPSILPTRIPVLGRLPKNSIKDL